MKRENDGEQTMWKWFRKKRITDGEIELILSGTSKDPDPEGWGNTFLYDILELKTGKIIGRCDLRLGNTKTLYIGGNIGYTVYVPYRGNHTAAKACILLFDVARGFGVKQLIITCNPDNIASYRTCELAGCTLKEIVPVPQDHELYLQGDREKAIFIKNLVESTD